MLSYRISSYNLAYYIAHHLHLSWLINSLILVYSVIVILYQCFVQYFFDVSR